MKNKIKLGPCTTPIRVIIQTKYRPNNLGRLIKPFNIKVTKHLHYDNDWKRESVLYQYYFQVDIIECDTWITLKLKDLKAKVFIDPDANIFLFADDFKQHVLQQGIPEITKFLKEDQNTKFYIQSIREVLIEEMFNNIDNNE